MTSFFFGYFACLATLAAVAWLCVQVVRKFMGGR